MSILRFECFSGISGDMILGSLLDLGLSLDDLRAGLEKLNVKNFSVSARKVVKSGVSATKFDVEMGEEHSHRHLSHIVKIIEGSELTPRRQGASRCHLSSSRRSRSQGPRDDRREGSLSRGGGH